MLQRVILACGALSLVVAAALLLVAHATVAGLYIGVEGGVVLLALLFERWRYRPRVDTRNGRWEATGERFVDPSSGRLVEVRYNPDTGQRDYVDAGP